MVAWPQVLEEMAASQQTLLFYEGQEWQGLSHYMGHQQLNRLALIIGPEGGFNKEEVGAAQEHGAQVVSLGPRILRTETASIVAATTCQMLYGDLKI